MKVLFILTILFLGSCPSNLIVKNSKSYQNTSHNFEQLINKREHIYFSIEDKWRLIVLKESDEFKLYFYCPDEKSKARSIVKKLDDSQKSILNEAFVKKAYDWKYVDLNSDYYSKGYDYSNGSKTHFYYQDKNGVKHGESRLTVIIKPNPLNTDLYNLLQTILINSISDIDC